MEKTVSVRCRVMFGQNIMMQKKPVEGVITVKADGSDSIQELKSKIAVLMRFKLYLIPGRYAVQQITSLSQSSHLSDLHGRMLSALHIVNGLGNTQAPKMDMTLHGIALTLISHTHARRKHLEAPSPRITS